VKTLSCGIAVLTAALAARSAEPEVSAAYPISGYWVFARGAAGQWPGTLDAIRRLGGDTLIQFGPRLNPVPSAEQAGHPVLSACRIDGRPVVEATREALAQLSPPAELARVFVLATPECFGAALLTWPGLDVCIADGSRRFWRLVIPVPAAVTAAAGAPRRYALVLIAGGTHDSLAQLLAEAEARRMQVFAGMPIPPPHPQYPWDPWLETLPVTLEVCRRVLADYRDRFGSSPALVGIYQSLETPVAARPLEAVLRAYRAMHPVVREVLPGRRILVSPYWDARTTPERRGTPPDDIRAGTQTIALCDVDIVAPQDSRGPGKVGLFWPHERDAPVDPRLEPAVGQRTYGEAYCANTRAYYQAAAQGLADLAGVGGPQVELWANLEAFEPGKGVPCGTFTECQRTSKERLDQAVMFAGPQPAKLISFMWDGLYASRGGLPATLAEEIGTDAARPIVVEARAEARAGQAGLALSGWRLAGATLELRWLDVAGEQTREITPGTAAAAPALGGPARLQALWVPVNLPAARLAVSVRGPGGRCHHPFILDRSADPH
jgi:hypothetical protein